ncbi:MAG: MBL fold metallo-hydrolase [Staphylothermus sp.]|nr:MBL fold metallo-hydrolase [Staphylothermus sp.]
MKPKIKMIGFDSMGTRGMATIIDTGNYKIIIDPGISLAPRRYGLPPHQLELNHLEKYLSFIRDELLDADVAIITHYHRDHYLYRRGEEIYYRDKVIFLKDPIRNINPSQKIRAYILLNKMNVKNLAKKIAIIDNKEYTLDNIKILGSTPMPHGKPRTRLGYVIMVLINIDNYKVLHASDVQGPISKRATDYIIRIKPDLLIISGPPTYMAGTKIDHKYIEQAFNNLVRIANKLPTTSTIILDHHFMRDRNYSIYLEELRKNIDKGRNIKVITAAEYMGYRVKQLEAYRKELWEKYNDYTREDQQRTSNKSCN